jgi:hypothetical protein
MQSDFTIQRNAKIRSRGYQQGRQAPPSTGQELIFVLFLILACTWLVPCAMIWELFHYGWSYTYNDWMTAHLSSGVELFMGFCWVAFLLQLFFGIRLLVK